jgi:hypothetical protein
LLKKSAIFLYLAHFSDATGYAHRRRFIKLRIAARTAARPKKLSAGSYPGQSIPISAKYAFDARGEPNFLDRDATAH